MFLTTSAVALAMAVSTQTDIDPSKGWRYSRWGMTPEEVVAASSGTAWLVDPPPVMGASDRTLAAGTSPGGAFDFKVTFAFNASRALTSVSLDAPPAQCPAVIRELNRVYGSPYHAPRANLAVQAAWEDRSKNLHVSIIASGLGCLVTYKPARPAVTGL